MSDGSESLDFDRQQAASRYRGTTFTPFVEEQLGSYVYLLTDPRNGEIFYVGKGLGNRVFAHASTHWTTIEPTATSSIASGRSTRRVWRCDTNCSDSG